jgi:hypothetical protein
LTNLGGWKRLPCLKFLPLLSGEWPRKRKEGGLRLSVLAGARNKTAWGLKKMKVASNGTLSAGSLKEDDYGIRRKVCDSFCSNI